MISVSGRLKSHTLLSLAPLPRLLATHCMITGDEAILNNRSPMLFVECCGKETWMIGMSLMDAGLCRTCEDLGERSLVSSDFCIAAVGIPVLPFFSLMTTRISCTFRHTLVHVLDALSISTAVSLHCLCVVSMCVWHHSVSMVDQS